ncbi:MAG: hypothetical protein J6Y28_01055 [Acholeplasmatales bacterium]|nr:hypothetical protein [Acholeplasmatales bacterium]
MHNNDNTFIYLVNKYDCLLGIYNPIEFDLEIKEEINKNQNLSITLDSNTINIRTKILFTIENIKGISVTRDRIIKNNKNGLFIYIRIDKEEIPSENKIEFDKYFKVVNDINKTNICDKYYHKFLKKIEKQKNKIKHNIQSIDIIAVLIFIISAIATAISYDRTKISIITVLTFLTAILPIINKIISLIKDRKVFNNTFYGTKDIKISDDIKKNIAFNIEKSSKINRIYKDFICSNFIDDNINEFSFMFSNIENENLRKYANNMPVILDKIYKQKTFNEKTAYGCILSEKIDSKQVLFDSKLCGINSDLNFYNGKKIHIKKVLYSDYVTNDEMIYRNITLNSDPTFLIDGRKIALDQVTNGFRDIEKSPLTNLIGINIILQLEANNKKYYLVNRQCSFTDVNQSKFVPSGSGSMDYNDYKMNKNNSFKDLLKYAMLRELNEESYIDSYLFHNNNDYLIKEDSLFELLGVARLFSKSGKPDFFGIITVKLDSEEELNKTINDILLHYNKRQFDYLKTEKEGSYLESTFMKIIDEKTFLDMSKIEKDSIQLRYVKYLINYYKNKKDCE